MTTTNNITGDKIQTRPNSDKYRENWDRIFGSKKCDVATVEKGVRSQRTKKSS